MLISMGVFPYSLTHVESLASTSGGLCSDVSLYHHNCFTKINAFSRVITPLYISYLLPKIIFVLMLLCRLLWRIRLGLLLGRRA